MHFVAVELKEGEHPDHAVKHFLVAAAENGIKFKRATSFGPFKFAATNFIRFQTDCGTYPPIVARLKAAGRSIIAPSTSGYKAYLTNGREGSVGYMLMQSVALPGYGKVYNGPGHEHWQAQFG